MVTSIYVRNVHLKGLKLAKLYEKLYWNKYNLYKIQVIIFPFLF